MTTPLDDARVPIGLALVMGGMSRAEANEAIDDLLAAALRHAADRLRAEVMPTVLDGEGRNTAKGVRLAALDLDQQAADMQAAHPPTNTAPQESAQ